MKIVSTLLCNLFLATPVFASSYSFDITLAHGSRQESLTKDQIERLAATYDFSRWMFTDSILIDEKAIPHSHPILTLHTRHLKDDDFLLSTLVHEQLHWFLTDRLEVHAAIDELALLYPDIPVGYPEGASDARSSYLHLIVGLLEYRAIQRLLGELRAWQVMEFWANDHYRWTYRTVIDQGSQIAKVVRRHRLFPEGTE